MAENTIKAVYEIKLEQGAALREFEKLNKQLVETRIKKSELTKENKKQFAIEQDLEKAIKDSGSASEGQVRALEKAKTKRAEINKQLSEAVIVEKALSSQTRELSNDLGGLTANGTRFRDKMAGAFQTAIEGTSAFQQLGAQSERLSSALEAIEQSAKANAQQLEILNQALKEGKITEEQYAEQVKGLNKELEATKASEKLLTAEMEKSKQVTADLEAKVEELNRQFNAGNIDQKQYTKGLAEIDKESANVLKSTSSIGDAFSKFGAGQGRELKSTLSGLALQYVGIGAAIGGVVRLFGDAARISQEFGAAQSNLAAILGKTKEEIGGLTEDAKLYGSTTVFTASQVSELQTELGKLGFTIPSIKAATPAILSLAAATGTDLANAATIAAQTLNAFQLPASETGRIVDVIAKSANLSAFDIDTFSAAMSNAAPSAKAVGVEVEQAAAMLSALVDAGIPAEKAGTDLRNIFIELEAKGLTMDEAFQQINSSQNKLSASTELFGKRSGSSGIILASNTQKLGELEEAYLGAAGTAEEMAAKQLDNLKGDKLLLTSAWEGFVLSVEDGSGNISLGLRKIVNGLSAILGYFTEINKVGDVLGGSIGTGDGSNIRNEKSIEAFREELEKLLVIQNKVTGRGQGEIGAKLAAGATVDGISDQEIAASRDTLRVTLERAKTTEDLDRIQAKLNNTMSKAAEGSKEWVVAAFSLNEVQKKRKQLDEEATQAVDDAAKAAVGAAARAEERQAAVEGEAVSIGDLKKQLEELKGERDDLAETDSDRLDLIDNEIKETTALIAKMEGRTKATAQESSAIKEANELAQKRIELSQELSKVAERQTQTPQQVEEAVATTVRDERVAIAGEDTALLLQIEMLYQADLQDIRTQYAQAYIELLAGSEGGVLQAKQAASEQEFSVLQEKHQREFDEAVRHGDDIAALLQRQAQEQVSYIVEGRTAEESALSATYEAEYQALDGNLIAQWDREEQYQIELATLRAQYREEDIAGAEAAAAAVEDIERQRTDNTLAATSSLLSSVQGLVEQGNENRIRQQDELIIDLKDNLANANTASERDLIKAQIASAEKEKAALEKRKKDQKAFAIAAALVNTYLAASSAFATTTPQYPAGVIAAAAAVISGLAMVAKISAFAQGGEIGKQPSGQVTSSWGTNVKRSNGDNVLVRAGQGFVTLKTGEKVLNERQQRELERRTHGGIWGEIGLPGFARGSMRSFRSSYMGHGYAEGGTVGLIAPRPSSATLVQDQMINSMEAISSRPSVVSVQEIAQVQNRTSVIENISSL